MNRYQIFISSTFEDLKEERGIVVENILKLEQIPAGMELFVAASEEQFNYIKRVIDESDYYVLIVGNRYGSTDESGISYTEKEYDYAVQKGLPVLAFIHSNPDSLPVNKSERDPEMAKRLNAFKDKVRKNRMISFWNSPQQLTAEVHAALNKAFKIHPSETRWERVSSQENKLSSAQSTEFSMDYSSVYNFCGEMLPKAENSVFISGVGMTIFNSIIYQIASINQNVSVNLAVPNLENDNVVLALKHFFGLSNSEWRMRKELFAELSTKINTIGSEARPINMLFLDMFVPIAYIAIDYKSKTENSCIQAFHFMMHDSREDWQSFFCTVRPDHVLYNRYRNQILMIESKNGKLAKV